MPTPPLLVRNYFHPAGADAGLLDFVAGFSKTGLARFSVGRCWSYVNLAGQTVIDAQFLDAGLFSHGLAAVNVSEQYWRYIDNDDRFAFNGSFSQADEFGECDLASVAQEDGDAWQHTRLLCAPGQAAFNAALAGQQPSPFDVT